jgi:hypothetical protein
MLWEIKSQRRSLNRRHVGIVYIVIFLKIQTPPLDMDDPEDLELPTLELGGVLLVVLLLEVLLGLVVVVLLLLGLVVVVFCLVVPERCVVVV